MKRFYVLITLLLLAYFVYFPSTSVLGQSASETQIGFYTNLTSTPGVRIEVPVEIRNVQALYALDITIKFDPSILNVEDVDASKSGVQIALGQFLDPGLVLFNTVDNQNGTIHFVMTQINPSEPKSGSGNLVVIYFKGIQEGKSELSFTNIQLSDRNGMQIAAGEVDAAITISSGVPTLEATSIPIQDPSRLTQIPTMSAATATPQATMTLNAQSTPANPTGTASVNMSETGETPMGITLTGSITSTIVPETQFL